MLPAPQVDETVPVVPDLPASGEDPRMLHVHALADVAEQEVEVD